MAWAELLPSGRYRGAYRDGRGKRRSAGTFTRKAEATQTWATWCDEWWPTRLVEASTLRHDAARRRNHLEPRWGHVPLRAITRQDVRGWASQLRRDGLSVATTQRCLSLLSASLGAAVDAEIPVTNAAAGIKLGGAVTPAQERF